MKRLALSVSNVCKSYPTSSSLFDSLFRSPSPKPVLQNISFQLEEGQVLGIMGRNGSGKSTLAKLLAKVIYPTSGSIISTKKVTALLEVGTGFSNELTGIENIFLSGAILGLSRQVIRSRLTEIVDFSDLGPAVYDQIRTYSSGMILRLAFSVAVCLDSDLLVLDEILSVGDKSFAEKSLQRMKDFAFSGKTVVLISHSTNTIEQFCNCALYIESGHSAGVESVSTVIRKYNAS